MSEPAAQAPVKRRLSFFVLSRLYPQPSGSVIAISCGIYKCGSLDQALCMATYQAREPEGTWMRFRCDQELPLLEFQQ